MGLVELVESVLLEVEAGVVSVVVLVPGTVGSVGRADGGVVSAAAAVFGGVISPELVNNCCNSVLVIHKSSKQSFLAFTVSTVSNPVSSRLQVPDLEAMDLTFS